MPPFTKKSLTSPYRVCLRLKQAREERGVSLEAIAEKTKINKCYLAALEECRFDDLKLPPLYQKNFVKKYVSALGLDPEPYVTQFFIEELDLSDRSDCHPKKTPRLSSLSNLPRLLRAGAVGLITLVLVLYLGLQVKNTLEPPRLALSSPLNGFIAHKNSIAIIGATDPEVKVSINGQQIKSDETGRFNESVTLNPGINTIVVSAEKKHGQITEETRHIIYKQTDRFSLTDSPEDG
ncbi:MAG: Transcriptional regulator [Candidatus Magasanikbacteria bacterium GW2011_GWA2_56_11]|uniref:Transcriptional regulator n=1 Tax=Candidatus Magasanikbacteria bacterium GW2011_GWA2_56_11 TaxID=1619044 RepID=A0A0G1YHX8_9BACT|nr:MAG: Transcriptional regulator [Candidatus Magasanikbacteria bacterium GW2011_GWA2_56_11]